MRVHLPWMSRADRRTWGAARTGADVCNLTARWLEGSIRSLPGYQPRRGPDPETEALIPTLAALCRAGLLTTCSQPGLLDGSWRQRAAVELLAIDPAQGRRIAAAALAAGFLATEEPIVVTVVDGEEYTRLGVADPGDHWSIVTETARAALDGAVRLTIAAPQYGPEGDALWALLDHHLTTEETEMETEMSMSTDQTPDPYEMAPPITREIGAVIELASAMQGWEPSEHEFHELYLRKAALLDRIALAEASRREHDEEPTETEIEATHTAVEAAETFMHWVESETGWGDDGERGAGDGWTLPTDAAGWTYPAQEYVRVEYARWALDAADVAPEH